MDAISEYVSNIAEDKIAASQCIMAVPARVEKVMSNNMCLVNLIANDTQLVVPNWSGCDVEVGDEVRLFYTGSILSERTAYIGAASYIVNRRLCCVEGNFIVDPNSTTTSYPKGQRVIPDNNSTNISQYQFRATHPQTVLVTFSGVMVGQADTGMTKVELYMDNVKYNYDYSISVFGASTFGARIYCPTITLPFTIDAGDHEIEVKIVGVGTNLGFYFDCCSYVLGQGLKELEVNNG